jgi:hypothetical protein
MKKKNQRHNRIIIRGAALAAALLLCLPGTGCASTVARKVYSGLFAEKKPSSPPVEVFSSETTSSASKPVIVTDVNGLTYENDIPIIHNDDEFNILMLDRLKKRSDHVEMYADNGYTINNDLLLYRYSLPYVSTDSLVMEGNREYWNIYISYYPGTLIADAYKKNDYMDLNEDERRTFEIALDFVRDKVNPEPNDVKKEKLIHDFICESTYYTNPASDDPIPRHCTAVGLLLDGYANCQGYADCFYMMCTMAGLTVDKQSGSAEGNLHVWNIVKLSGKWYSMDLTFDDTTFYEDGSGYPAYIYFNSGKDILLRTHSVPAENELIEIEDASDENYFYYSSLFELKGFGSDEDTAKHEVAAMLENCHERGENYVSYMLEGSRVDSYDIVNEIKSYIPGDPARITISTFHVENNTYILGEPR